MYKVLNARAIGLKATLTEIVEASLTGHFSGIDLSLELVSPLAQTMGLKYCQQILNVEETKPGCWTLPTRWRDDDETFQQELQQLPEQAQLAKDLGYTRVTASIWPASDERPFEENLQWHVQRIGAIADIVGQFEQRLGLEYLATESLRDGAQFEFIHDLAALKQLIEAVEQDNVGIVLDSWHWHLAGETPETIRGLKPDEIVAVHVSDAPADVPNNEQIDNVRRLPGSTGVIDITGFMEALDQIGYDGPVAAEPFTSNLRSMNKMQVVSAVAAAMNKIWPKPAEEEDPESVTAEAKAN